MLRDPNFHPYTALDSFSVAKATPAVFNGGTANARGDDGGTSDPLTLFTVTGEVLVRIFGVCTTDLVSAGAGTLSVGIANNTAILIALTTATDIDAGEIWFDATPSVGDTLANLPGSFIIVNGADIIETVGTADITAGQIYYICLWRALSGDGNVVNV
ncbi:MAG: hypothetical protein QME66_04185 [Candidatus Eisenbacteria bacterium]|nr:hypothetical protein [Candidatus Eisenbacteria bacterium]